jgi:predicted ferric reductase
MTSESTAGSGDHPARADSSDRATAVRPSRMDSHGTTGITALAAVAVGNVVLWLLARPPGEPIGRFLGELCGAEAVLLFVCSLVLATVLPPIEWAFGGLDRVARWHRRVATAGVLLLVPHIALVTSPPDPYATSLGHGLGDVALFGLVFLTVWALAPSLRAARWPGLVRRLARATYERWLTAHRLTGLFIAVALVHGATVDVVLHRSALLRVTYLIVGGIGVAAYLYRELLARYVIPAYQYTVAAVERPNPTTVDVSLDPVRDPITFTAGQFVFVAFGGPGGWQRHPFTVASPPSARRLAISIKAAGDATREIYEKLDRGVPARVIGPFGGFDYRSGGQVQIWIAGGIGITPFLSWLRALDDDFDRDVDFYYSVAHASDALFLDEITAATAGRPSLRPHFVDSERDGLLSAATIMNGRHDEHPWIYMCGPPPMMSALSKGFRDLGVPAAQIRWEQFNVR